MISPYKNAVETTHELPWLFNTGPLTAYAPPHYSTLLGLLAFFMKNTRFLYCIGCLVGDFHKSKEVEGVNVVCVCVCAHCHLLIRVLDSS